MGGIAETTVTSGLAVLGSHGGAGARTVVDLLRIAGAEVELMQAGQHLPPAAAPVLVARSTAAGIGAAASMLAAWHPDVPEPWLVIVADVPAPPPPAVRYRVRALTSQVRGAVVVPYLWPLRAVDRVDDVSDTAVVRRAAQLLAAELMAVRV